MGKGVRERKADNEGYIIKQGVAWDPGLSLAGKSWERVENVLPLCPRKGVRKPGCLNINARPSRLRTAPLETQLFQRFEPVLCMGQGYSSSQEVFLRRECQMFT